MSYIILYRLKKGTCYTILCHNSSIKQLRGGGRQTEHVPAGLHWRNTICYLTMSTFSFNASCLSMTRLNVVWQFDKKWAKHCDIRLQRSWCFPFPEATKDPKTSTHSCRDNNHHWHFQLCSPHATAGQWDIVIGRLMKAFLPSLRRSKQSRLVGEQDSRHYSVVLCLLASGLRQCWVRISPPCVRLRKAKWRNQRCTGRHTQLLLTAL